MSADLIKKKKIDISFFNIHIIISMSDIPTGLSKFNFNLHFKELTLFIQPNKKNNNFENIK